MNSPKFSLDDIRRHPNFPFDAWQQEDVSFLMLELFWAERVRLILGDEMANYVPLFDTERDGNPILTLTNQVARRGLRLVVLENEEDKPPYPKKSGPEAFYSLYAYMNIGRLSEDDTPVDELVMLVRVDDRYNSYFEALLRQHCCDYASTEQMEDSIATYEAKFSMGNPAADLSED